MNCADLHARFSEYYDGTGEPSFLGAADAHLETCADCRRYRDVVARGSTILRGSAPVAVSEDFLPRLQHRIYHLEDGPALGRTAAGSATTVSTAVAIAALIALAAWSPTLVRAPRVALPPIVVSSPEPRVVGVQPPELWDSPVPEASVSAVDRGLWDDPRLFTRYSPLMAQQATLRRADLE